MRTVTRELHQTKLTVQEKPIKNKTHRLGVHITACVGSFLGNTAAKWPGGPMTLTLEAAHTTSVKPSQGHHVAKSVFDLFLDKQKSL